MSPNDPVGAAIALGRLQTVQTRYREVQEERRQAILEAVRTQVPLREVARAADCSHESVRRIVAADGAVTIEIGGQSFALTGTQIEMLIYKLSGMAHGAFPGDLQLLDAGDAWIPAAGELANALQAAMSDEDGAPVVLDRAQALALYQILRLTYFGGRTVMQRLFDALHAAVGDGQQHVIAVRLRARPKKGRS